MEIPVLVVAFNRPQSLSVLLDHLRELKPASLYVAVDGPRPERDEERDLVAQTRRQVGNVDWPCEVRTLFRETNLGCGRGVSGALDWFFANEEVGIVLEDDILPRPSFFPFAEELLHRYAEDSRVWAVAGTNYVPQSSIESRASYRFSAIPHIWGWGSWRRSWLNYRFDMRGWRSGLPARRLWSAVDRSPLAFAYWTAMFDLMARRAVDTWDFQFVHAAFAQGALTATSNTNLVENLGFGTESTHTAETPNYLLPPSDVRFPLRHPASVLRDRRADRWSQRNVFGATPLGMARQGGRYLYGRLRSDAGSASAGGIR